MLCGSVSNEETKTKNDAVVRSVLFTASFVLSICFHGKCKLNAICIFYCIYDAYMRCCMACHSCNDSCGNSCFCSFGKFFAIFKFNAKTCKHSAYVSVRTTVTPHGKFGIGRQDQVKKKEDAKRTMDERWAISYSILGAYIYCFDEQTSNVARAAL